ncbi:hypothetical protein [Oryzomonas rubra]|uniref:Uncharacterized protein n=1 Tax=Oryzomonas rubra TaxID=2509454 RepID=A0A5A9XQX8_9BACT|nr:hypothetical protein [Oryzomonas rubra]KAA0895456.1 hypothetical protein ET418_02750 [Oryzomonas rubra]
MNSHRLGTIIKRRRQDVDAAKITLDLTSAEVPGQRATVISWHPLNIKINVQHPRLDWIERLMDNKFKHNEQAAFESNAKDYLVLIDDIALQAVAGLVEQQQQIQQRIRNATTSVIVLSTALYVWLPLLGIAVDTTGIITFFVMCLLIEKRKQGLLNMMKAQARNLPTRCRQFCDAYSTAHNNESALNHA